MENLVDYIKQEPPSEFECILPYENVAIKVEESQTEEYADVQSESSGKLQLNAQPSGRLKVENESTELDDVSGKGKKVRCPICREIFLCESIKNHIELHGAKKIKPRFQCKVCSRLYISASLLANHMKVHQRNLKSGAFKCETCDRNFNSRALLHEHLEDHVNNDSYECQRCRKKFKGLKRLEDHKLKSRSHRMSQRFSI